MDINIVTFINPHLFFVTKSGGKRFDVLKDISSKITKSHVPLQDDKVEINQMVAVYKDHDLVRATIEDICNNSDINKPLYACWLIDYGTLIQTDTVFKLPQEIKKIEAQAKQACLKSICYLKEVLELGVTGTIKSIPSIVPPSGVTQYTLELISDCDKLLLDISETLDDILIGDVLIYKNGKVTSLIEELCSKRLIMVDEHMFQKIKYSTKVYKKTHLEMIHQMCKYQKHNPPTQITDTSVLSSTKMANDSSNRECEEDIDIYNPKPLENGRRRRELKTGLNNSIATSESEDDKQSVTSQKSRISSLLNKHKQLVIQNQKAQNNFDNEPKLLCNTSKGLKEQSLNTSREKCEVINQEYLDSLAINSSPESQKLVTSNSTSKAAALIKKLKQNQLLKDKERESKVKQLDLGNKRLDLSSGSMKSEEGLDTLDSSIEDRNVEGPSNVCNTSMFEDMVSSGKQSISSGIVFMPAGSENQMSRIKKVASQTAEGRKKVVRPKVPRVHRSEPIDSDCPTIKVPKRISGHQTEDKTSAEDTETKSTKKEEDLSDPSPPEQLTRQNFCKLVNGCQCKDCKMNYEDDDWDAPVKFAQSDTVPKKEKLPSGSIIRPPRLLKAEEDNGVQKNEIWSVEYSIMTKMQKQSACRVLVHGESIPNPIKHVSQVNIHKDIYNSINRLNYKEAKRIQFYAFPAITRNQHVFMINDAGSGKTMAYLPILSSFIMEKEERYSQLFKLGGGPIVVILCSNSRKCEEIYDLTRLIFDRQRSRVGLVTYPGYGNISNIDILITMPVILTNLISSRAINFKRLCHLVLEDADQILKYHQPLVKKFLVYADQVLTHRSCPKSIQIILCGEQWTPHIEGLLKELNKVPLVCIGNYLEAALYGNMTFAMKFLETACKEQDLKKLLIDTYKINKSVVLCNPDQVDEIQVFLMLKGIDATPIEDDMSQEDILYLEEMWNNNLPGKYSVLICSDFVFNTLLTITNASLLIHYSLPSSWTQFIRRFGCLLENNPTPLDIKERKTKVGSVVFIDEECEPRMSKFCNFVKNSGLEKHLSEKLKAYFQDVAMQEEVNRISKKVDLCVTLKIFGKCESLHCKKRHVLNKNLDNSDFLPKNGTIKFQVLKMTDTTTCSIKLIEHFDNDGKSVQKFDDISDKISDILSRKDNYYGVSRAVLNHLYLHKEDGKYHRGKLVEMDEFALLFLIDRGIYCKSDISKLFKMPEELKNIRPQCYEVYLANLIPPHADSKFSRLSHRKAQFLMDSNCPNSIMTAIVQLQLGNHLWLGDVCEEREMYDKSLPSLGFQLTRELVKQNLAVNSEKTLTELYDLCKKEGIDLPAYKVKKMETPKIRKSVEQVKPQWAFLDMENINEVTFSCAINPGEFYVKLNKYSKQLTDLERDIQKKIRKPFYPTLQKIEVGYCYLVKDEQSGNHCRAIAMNVLEDHAHMFCVDYGDEVTVPLETLKHISNDLISKLPFQSIQCSMYGIRSIDQEWSTASTDLLYEMGFEPNTDIFRTLFIKTCSKENNTIISKQNSYSVLVKDGFNSRHILLNELLIECGFGIPNDDKIEDFDIPVRCQEDDETVHDILDSEDDVEEIKDEGESNYFDKTLEDFECEIFDFDNFMVDLKFLKEKEEKPNSIREEKRKDELPQIKAAPSVDYLTPECLWSQTDKHVKLNIQIPDVEQCKINIIHSRVFHFCTFKNDKKYLLKLILYEKVDKTFQHTVLGPLVRVTFTKTKAEEWPRLLFAKEKPKNIRYDVSTINCEEKPKKFLQLDLTESDDSDNENDGMVYHVCSDLDSEYDYDIPNCD